MATVSDDEIRAALARRQQYREHLALSQRLGQQLAGQREAPPPTAGREAAVEPPACALCPECGLCTSLARCERCGAKMTEALEAWRAAGIQPPDASTRPPAPTPTAPPMDDAEWAALSRGMAAVADLSARIAAGGRSGEPIRNHIGTRRRTHREKSRVPIATSAPPLAANDEEAAGGAAGLADCVLAFLSVRTLEADPEEETECQVTRESNQTAPDVALSTAHTARREVRDYCRDADACGAHTFARRCAWLHSARATRCSRCRAATPTIGRASSDGCGITQPAPCARMTCSGSRRRRTARRRAGAR